MGGRSPESQWSDRASLQHQDSLESRRSEPASRQRRSPSKNVTAAANKVAANSEEDELLQIKRRQWDESTAKRIHVVVRARPLNIREIKADARVKPKVLAIASIHLSFAGCLEDGRNQ